MQTCADTSCAMLGNGENMNPLVSVIIPVYNVEKYLHQAVDSILLQTYPHLEVILVDDGSRDTSGRICDEYAQKDPRVKVIHQANAGLSAARNAGLDAAGGDYIYFIDSDDYVDTVLCKTVLDAFTRHDADIVVFDCIRVDENGANLNAMENRHGIVSDKEEMISELLSGNINDYAWNKMYKRQVFDGVRYPLGRIWEDMGTTYKLFLNSETISCIPHKLYYYRQRENSIANSMNETALRDIFLMQKSRYDHLREIYPTTAELGFSMVASSALALYDRSLWKRVDETVLNQAVKFLNQNREKILDKRIGAAFSLFYFNRKCYCLVRIAKHRVGDVVKRAGWRRSK